MFKISKLLEKIRGNKDITYKSGWDLSKEGISSHDWVNIEDKLEKTRKAIKPVHLVKDICTSEPKTDMNDLDSQIAIVEERMKIITDLYDDEESPRDEKIALGFLNARKNYEKTKELFQWPITTSGIITDLCKRYKVQMSEAELYMRTVPTEGIREMKKFLSAYKKVRKDEPVFKIIIDEGGREEKKDPILLGGSPFGNWYYILGAWDKEVEIVDKLVYSQHKKKKRN